MIVLNVFFALAGKLVVVLNVFVSLAGQFCVLFDVFLAVSLYHASVLRNQFSLLPLVCPQPFLSFQYVPLFIQLCHQRFKFLLSKFIQMFFAFAAQTDLKFPDDHPILGQRGAAKNK